MNQLKCRMCALAFMILIILMPVSYAQAARPVTPATPEPQTTGERLQEKARTLVQADVKEQARNVKEAIQESIENPPEGPESLVGQDIAIEVTHYQPTPVPTSLIESQSVLVNALLQGRRTNPAVAIQAITRVEPKILKVTTLPAGKPVSIGALRHMAPRAEELRYDNLGYLVIPINRIPREADVPDSIIIDVLARIYLDVGSGLTFGPQEDILEKESEEQWRLRKEDHRFYFGYIRANEINEKGASFTVYDDAMNVITTTPVISVGQNSGSISATRLRFGGFGRVFDRFTIKVNDIRSKSDRVRLYVARDGKTELKTLSKGQALFPGSYWYIGEVFVSPDGKRRDVELKNRKKSDTKKLSMTESPKEQSPAVQTIKANELESFLKRMEDPSAIENAGYQYNSLDLTNALSFFESFLQKTPTQTDVTTILTYLHAIEKYYETAIEKYYETQTTYYAGMTSEYEHLLEMTRSLIGRYEKTTPSSVTTMPQGNLPKQLQEIRDALRAVESQPGERLYSPVIDRLENFAKEQLSRELAQEAFEVIQRIQSYYIEQLGTVTYALNQNPKNEDLKTKRDTLSALVSRLDALLRKYESFFSTTPAVAAEAPTSGMQAFELATSTYRSLLDRYPQSPYAPEALYHIGLIQWTQLKNPFAAAEAFEKLLREYTQEQMRERGIEPGMVQQQLQYMESLVKMQTRLHEALVEIPDVDDSLVTVSLVSIEKPTLGQFVSKAYLSVNGGIEQAFTEGQTFIAGEEKDRRSYRIERIRDNEAEIWYKYPENSSWIQTLYPGSLKVGENTLVLSRDGKIIARVTLKRTDLQREVSVTVAPDAEKAFTNSQFKLRIGIEKRPFGLPLFSETIDQEIVKVDELLIKLNKIIDNAVKIHEYWKKFCFITYGTIMVKNLLFGGKAAVARSKVNEYYREQYAERKIPGCEKSRSFEDCMFTISDKYNADIDRAEDIIAKIRDEAYQNDGFGNLGESYLDDRKDLYFYNKWLEKAPGDKRVATKYFSTYARLKNQQMGRAISDKFIDQKLQFRTYEELGKTLAADDVNKIHSVIEHNPMLDQKRAEYKNDYARVYDENANAIFETYKNEKLNEEFGRKFIEDDLKKKYPAYVSEIDAVKKQLAPRTGYVVEVQQTRIQKRTIDGREMYVISLPDHEVNIGPDPKIGDFTDPDTGVKYKFVDKETATQHIPRLTLVEGSRAGGKLESLSVDAQHYIGIKYSPSGKIENTYVYKRLEPNSMMGLDTDVRVGGLDDMITYFQSKNPALADKLTRAKGCIGQANKKLVGNRYKKGDTNVVDCGHVLGKYSVDASVKSAGPSCIDFMSPTECKVLFNACDPVICPASRCDLGGAWHVDDVVQTGIIGSVALCLPNIKQGVVMPVCMTGIIAGLQNIRSILQGYKQCLASAKVEGGERSVGICDRIRSVGICEMLWREAIAIMNLKGSIINFAAKQIEGATYGGGEYSTFKQSFDNALGSLDFFTQDYAKNTFAQYAGGTLPDIGAEVCKAAIFGKAPGLGNFFSEVLKPESPPQFTAFFDERSRSDIPDKPVSVYSVFYHMYAGENQDITYSIWLQTRDLNKQLTMPVKYLVNSRFLPRGKFASENVMLQNTLSGYKEICVVVTSDVYGQQGPVCGFGKASTNFFVNWVEDQLTQSQLKTRVTSEEECTPHSGRATTLSYQDASLGKALRQAPRAAVGGFSTGLITTGAGLIRKCSSFDPGIGSAKGAWVPVGDCGKDERGRNLGTCWLYQPAALEMIKDLDARAALNASLENLARDVIKESNIPGLETLKDNEVLAFFNKAKTLSSYNNEKDILEAIKIYDRIINSAFISDDYAAQALLEKGRAYERIGIGKSISFVARADDGAIYVRSQGVQVLREGVPVIVPRPVTQQATCFKTIITSDREGRRELTSILREAEKVYLHVVPLGEPPCPFPQTDWYIKTILIDNAERQTGLGPGGIYTVGLPSPLEVLFTPTRKKMLNNNDYFVFDAKRTISGREEEAFITLPIIGPLIDVPSTTLTELQGVISKEKATSTGEDGCLSGSLPETIDLSRQIDISFKLNSGCSLLERYRYRTLFFLTRGSFLKELKTTGYPLITRKQLQDDRSVTATGRLAPESLKDLQNGDLITVNLVRELTDYGLWDIFIGRKETSVVISFDVRVQNKVGSSPPDTRSATQTQVPPSPARVPRPAVPSVAQQPAPSTQLSSRPCFSVGAAVEGVGQPDTITSIKRSNIPQELTIVVYQPPNYQPYPSSCHFDDSDWKFVLVDQSGLKIFETTSRNRYLPVQIDNNLRSKIEATTQIVIEVTNVITSEKQSIKIPIT